MARQIRTAFGPNAFTTVATFSAVGTLCASSASQLTTTSIIHQCVLPADVKMLKITGGSVVGPTRKSVATQLCPNSFVGVQTWAPFYGNSCTTFSTASSTTDLMPSTFANLTKWTQFVLLLPVGAPVVRQIMTSLATQGASTMFNNGATGVYYAVLQRATANYSLAVSSGDTQQNVLTFSLAPLLRLRYITEGLGTLGSTYRAITTTGSPNVFCYRFAGFMGGLDMRSRSTAEEQTYDGYMETYDVLRDVKLILLTGPGEIDDEAVWRITRAEFDKFSGGKGYAFAKVLVLGRNANPRVCRLFLVDPSSPTLAEVELITPVRQTSHVPAASITWAGPTSFELKVGELFALDLTRYIVAEGVDTPEYDIIVLEGPGYVLENTYYFVPTQPGSHQLELEISELRTGAQLKVELALHIVRSEPQNVLEFLVPTDLQERFVFPFPIVFGQLQDMRVEIPALDSARLVDNVLIIYKQLETPLEAVIYCGKKLYCVVKFKPAQG